MRSEASARIQIFHSGRSSSSAFGHADPPSFRSRRRKAERQEREDLLRREHAGTEERRGSSPRARHRRRPATLAPQVHRLARRSAQHRGTSGWRNAASADQRCSRHEPRQAASVEADRSGQTTPRLRRPEARCLIATDRDPRVLVRGPDHRAQSPSAGRRCDRGTPAVDRCGLTLCVTF